MRLALAEIKLDRAEVRLDSQYRRTQDFLDFLRHAAENEELSGSFQRELMMAAECMERGDDYDPKSPIGSCDIDYHLEASELFLALAVQSGLGLYMAHKLKSNVLLLKSRKRPLLFYAIIPPPSEHRYIRKTSFPFYSDPELVHVLLRFGANPNKSTEATLPGLKH
jgi:hypothetical protein